MTDHDAVEQVREEREGQEVAPRGHSRWLMIACCIPMIAIAVAIVASGAGVGFLVVAVLCTAMMALMMGSMSHGSDEHKH
jgi:hypothetical protein